MGRRLPEGRAGAGSRHRWSRRLVLCVLLCACSPSGPSAGDGGIESDSDNDSDLFFDGDPADSDAPDAAEPQCMGNSDSVIERSEAVTVLGASLYFLVNAAGTSPTVDTAGVVEEGVRIWDFSAALPADQRVEEVVLAPGEYWFSEHFADASHATLVPGFEGVLGVYRASEEEIALLGMASSSDDSTLIVYDVPVRVAIFPLEVGRTWTEESRATGRLMHVAFNAVETYAFTVDAAGLVRVPAGTFPTVRVRTDLVRSESGPFDDSRISYAWLAECWGRVAYVGSSAGERDPGFTTVAQYWRLTLR